MRKRPFKNGQELDVEISDLAFGGKGIAKIPTDKGDFTLFVLNSIPGQIVRCKITKSQPAYAEASLVEVLKTGPLEIEVPYHPIPGAPYITLPIREQIKFKKSTTMELFKRIGKVENAEDLFDEFIQSPKSFHYRNKMEYSFSAIVYNPENGLMEDGFGLGFKHRGIWWSVDNVDGDSGIFDEEFETKLIQIRKYLEATGLPAWHAPQRSGFYRFLVVRKSYFTNQLLINFVTTDKHLDKFDIKGFVALINELLGNRVAGIIHTINSGEGDRVDANFGNTNLLQGAHKIIEVINGLEFEISPSSFFQPNPKCAEKLYQKVLDYADAANGDKNKYILDLFCGTGTIAQLLAKESKRKVVGVDIVEEAIEDARVNAQRNRVRNVRFFAEDVDYFLLNHPEFIEQIETIVLDPPRAGISPKALKKMILFNAQKIVYVSCNPATQARDTELLRESGYRLVKFSLADQFPHTSHIESIALYEKI